MTTNPSNPRKPVSEEQLVDWIDGALSPEDVRRLAAESGRADLHDRVGQMQRHRDALRSLNDVQSMRAPANLHDRVMAALERESLVGHESVEQELRKLEQSAPTATTAATQLRLVRDTSDNKAAWTTRTPSLALAAGLLLLVVGGAYWTTQMLRSASPHLAKNQKMIAKGDASAVDAVAANQNTDAVESTMAAKGSENADAARSFALATPAPNVAPLAAGPAAREVTIDQAVELAREGRLAIRVVSRDLKGLPKFEQDGAQPKGNQSWQLSRDVPPAVLAAALPATSEASRAFVRASREFGGSTMARGSAQPMFSAASLITPLIGPGAAVTSLAPAAVASGPSLTASYLLDMPQTERAFDVIRAVLRDRLKGEVVFAELPDVVPTVARVDAQSALWWTKPSGQWSQRVTVPVLVER
jgi:hypothetical protein